MALVNNIIARYLLSKALLFWLIGLCIGNYIVLSTSSIIVLVGICLLLLVMLYITRYKGKMLFQVLLYLFIGISGLAYINICKAESKFAADSPQAYIGTIDSYPEEKAKSQMMKMTIVPVDTPYHSTKIIAYLGKDSLVPTLQPGDQIIFKSRLDEFSYLGNRYEFDYRSYMRRQGIIYSTYIYPDNIKILDSKNMSLRRYAEISRMNLISFLRNSGLSEKNLSVVSALTLGYRDYLEKDTQAIFANTGAMHVLAVSGLHVGIIYFIILMLTKLMVLNGFTRRLRPLIIILTLWSFAFITGLSPSVQRATLMLTILVIGKALNKNMLIFNTIFTTALILTFFNPQIIFELGFQLSFLAVSGIIIIYPKLHGLLRVRNKFLNWAWSLLCVSFAAQIAVAPLSLFVFKQFPTLFPLANFVVIPYAFIALILTILSYVSFSVPLVSHFFVGLLNASTTACLSVLESLNSLSFSTIITTIPLWQMFVLYLVIILLLLYVYHHRKRHLFLALSVSILLLSFALFDKQQRYSPYIYVYNTPKPGEVLVQYSSGNKNIIIASKSIYKETIDNIAKASRAEGYGKAEIEYISDDASIYTKQIEDVGLIINLSDTVSISCTNHKLIPIAGACCK
ncbi:MAG: ComEC/Rec2 family competence protein [Bacteroidales bacterium]